MRMIKRKIMKKEKNKLIKANLKKFVSNASRLLCSIKNETTVVNIVGYNHQSKKFVDLDSNEYKKVKTMSMIDMDWIVIRSALTRSVLTGKNSFLHYDHIVRHFDMYKQNFIRYKNSVDKIISS